MKKQKKHSFSRSAVEFAYLAKVFGLDELMALNAYEMAHVDGYDPKLASLHSVAKAKNVVLEYSQKIVLEAEKKCDHVLAYRIATVQKSDFFKFYILQNSGRVLPKLVSLNLL